MINKKLVERIFSATSYERWNDHPRPISFTELGKQAHKMMISWLIAKDYEKNNGKINWNFMIESGINEFLYRMVVTDIRPSVFFHLEKNKDKKKKLDEWVNVQVKEELETIPNGFYDRFKAYDKYNNSPERKILDAAHYLSSNWEFGFVESWAANMYGIKETKKDMEKRGWEIIHELPLPIISDIITKPDEKEGAFVSLCGQLAFQKRWTQTQRSPETSVLGHSFFVAVISWLISNEVGLSKDRQANNFLAGLFHDLPEVLTRDIISPVKNSVEGLADIVAEYEHKLMKEKIFSLLPKETVEELKILTANEFETRVSINGKTTFIEEKDALKLPKEVDAKTIDGMLIRVADKFGAYVECVESIENGIATPILKYASKREKELMQGKKVYDFDVEKLFDVMGKTQTTQPQLNRGTADIDNYPQI